MPFQFDMSSPSRRDTIAPRSRLMFSALLTGALLTCMSLIIGAAQAADPAAKKVVNLARGKEIAGTLCVACHAADGNSVLATNPILAAQHPEYLAKQLHNFKIKEGATAAERNNAIMAGFASLLTPEDIQNVAAFYAAQKISPAAAKRPELLELGQKIYRAGAPERGLAACVGCHSPNGAGIPAQYPRLAGQHPEYTESTLNAFRRGERANSAQMMTIASKMSEREIAAVAEYIASLR
jgi:cytochrome c553